MSGWDFKSLRIPSTVGSRGGAPALCFRRGGFWPTRAKLHQNSIELLVFAPVDLMQLHSENHALPHGAVPSTPVPESTHLHLIASKEDDGDVVGV